MKYKQFIREIKSKGATVVEGAKHTKAYRQGRFATIKRHNELSEQYCQLVRKQLGID